MNCIFVLSDDLFISQKTTSISSLTKRLVIPKPIPEAAPLIIAILLDGLDIII
jgi:hypothetical protein